MAARSTCATLHYVLYQEQFALLLRFFMESEKKLISNLVKNFTACENQIAMPSHSLSPKKPKGTQ